MTSRNTPTVTIPELTVPFPAREHPHAPEIDEATVQWLLDFGLIRDADQEHYIRTIELGRWFPQLLPDGDMDKALLGSQLTAWFTMVDDQIAEKHGNRAADLAMVMARLVRCETFGRLPDTTAANDSMERALHDLTLRLRTAATAEQLLRLHWHTVQYYLGITTEAAHVAQGITPTIADYTRIRHLTTCIPPFFVMSEIARGFSTPLTTVLHPDVQTLTTLAVDLTALINDIIGLPRDLERGDPWTYARVLIHHQQCDYQQAVKLMTEQIRENIQRFTQLASAVRDSSLPQAPNYVTVLQDLIAGHLKWQRHSPRYTINGWH